MTFELIDDDLEFTLVDVDDETPKEVTPEKLKILIRENLESENNWCGTSKATYGLTIMEHITDANTVIAQMVEDGEVLEREHPACYATKQYRLAPAGSKAVYGR